MIPETNKQFHTHVDERGFIVKCYHESKSVLSDYGFWIGITIGFPIEHFIWEKLWPLSALTKILGL